MDRDVLIDSNVFIDALRERRDPLLAIARRVELVNVVSCGVVRAEVLRGVKGLKLRQGLEDFFAVTQMVPTNEATWTDVWKLAWKLDRLGRVLPLPDLIIATCAMQVGAAILTRDAHFKRVPDLEVIDP